MPEITDEMVDAFTKAHGAVWKSADPITQDDAVRVSRLAVRAGLQAAYAVAGRCGQPLPKLFVAPPPNCGLPAGHAGWHRADTGVEWAVGNHVPPESDPS